MTWVKLDDQFFRNPKMIKAGINGRSLFLVSICYCSSQQIDRISKAMIPMLCATADVPRTSVQRLVDVGLWEPNETGWTVSNEGWKAIFDRPHPRILGALREQVYERDGHRCQHCGTDTNLTMDHVLAFSKGGRTVLENLQTLCQPCNSSKGNR